MTLRSSGLALCAAILAGALAWGEAVPAQTPPPVLPQPEAPRPPEPAADPDTAIPDATKTDVRAHLDRLEQIVDSLLAVAPAGEPIAAEEEREVDEPKRVGTTGTPATARTGETVVVERAKLEDLRLHVRQAREALRQVEDEQR